MPHNVPEEKEWLHLRDAICLGDVDAIVDELWSIQVGESVQEIDPETGLLTGQVTFRAIPYEDMQDILKAEKLQIGKDACAVVDKSTFQEYTNQLITQVMNIYQPEETQIDSYKESMASGRWDHIFDDMVGRASGRIVDSPSHYTRETPQGALEGMEERLVQDAQFRQRMAQDTLNAALSQMELRVGEIAEAIRQMGTTPVSQETVEKIEDATEVIEEVAEQLSGRARGDAIREYILSLGPRASQENVRTVVAALQDRFPGITERDIQNAIRILPPGTLGSLPKGRPGGTPDIPLPRTGSKLRMVADQLLLLGEEASITDMATFLKNVNAANPGLDSPIRDVDYYSTIRRYRGLPELALPGRGRRRTTEEPEPPPPPIQAQPMEGGDLGDLLGGLERPQRQRRNGGPSWSRRYYSGLTEAQHDANDAWFEGMLRLLKPDGILGVPGIEKAFNKQGEEVPWSPDIDIMKLLIPGGPEHRVTRSWQVLVIIRPDPDWIANQLRFATREEAQEWADRWTVHIPGLEDIMIAPSEDPPNK